MYFLCIPHTHEQSMSGLFYWADNAGQRCGDQFCLISTAFEKVVRKCETKVLISGTQRGMGELVEVKCETRFAGEIELGFLCYSDH